MFQFQASTIASGSSTAVAGKAALSAQEFSKKVNQLYVRNRISYDVLQGQFGESTTKFKNFLNTSTLERLRDFVPGSGGKIGKKASALIDAGAEYDADFSAFEKKFNLLKGALRGNDSQKIEEAIGGISMAYFNLAVSQAKFAQLLEDYDIKGVGYAKASFDILLDTAMMAGIVTGIGSAAALTREGMAIALREFMAKGGQEIAKNSLSGAVFFTVLGIESENYSFAKISAAMRRVGIDQAGALDELSGILSGMKKRAGEDGEQFEGLIAAVDAERSRLRQKLKADPSYKMDAGRILAYFNESLTQMLVFEMGFGFFKTAGKAAAPKMQRAEAPAAETANGKGVEKQKAKTEFFGKSTPNDGPALQATFFPFASLGGKRGKAFPVEITQQTGAQCVANSFYYALSWLGFRGEKNRFIEKFQTATGTVISGPRFHYDVAAYVKQSPELSAKYTVRNAIPLEGETFKTPDEARGFAKGILKTLKDEEGQTAMMLNDNSPNGFGKYGMVHSTMIYAAKDAKGQAKFYEVNTYGSEKYPFEGKPVEIAENAVLFKLLREETPTNASGPAKIYTATPYSALFISKADPPGQGKSAIKNDAPGAVGQGQAKPPGIRITPIPKDNATGIKIKKIEPKAAHEETPRIEKASAQAQLPTPELKLRLQGAAKELGISENELTADIMAWAREKLGPDFDASRLSVGLDVGGTNNVYLIEYGGKAYGVMKEAGLAAAEQICLPIYEAALFPQGYSAKTYGKIAVMDFAPGRNMENTMAYVREFDKKLKKTISVEKGDIQLMDPSTGETRLIPFDADLQRQFAYEYGRQMYLHFLLAIHDPHPGNFRMFAIREDGRNVLKLARIDMEGATLNNFTARDAEKAKSSDRGAYQGKDEYLGNGGWMNAFLMRPDMGEAFRHGFVEQAGLVQANSGKIAELYHGAGKAEIKHNQSVDVGQAAGPTFDERLSMDAADAFRETWAH